MRLIALALLSGLLAFANPALAGNTAQEEANKKMVIDFYDKGLNQRDYEGAVKHFGPRYIQHNPIAPDASKASAVRRVRKPKFPDAKQRDQARDRRRRQVRCTPIRSASPASAVGPSSTSSGWGTARSSSTGT